MAVEDEVYLPEVLYEFSRQGNHIKVCAIDPITNTEVVTIGARGYSQEYLERVARRKLAYVIARKRRRGAIR